MTDRILVAFDESPQARAALEHALATFPSAEVTALHVTDPREWVYVDDIGGGYYSDAAYEEAQASAENLLAEAAALAAELDREIETESEVGRPVDTIVSTAEAGGFDHIVLGSHGRTGLSRFLLGSVAEAVARRSPVSVTIIRETPS